MTQDPFNAWLGHWFWVPLSILTVAVVVNVVWWLVSFIKKDSQS